jgi:hypothetical protein
MEEKDKKISDILKKVVNTGIGAAFMTEEALKNVIGDLPLPKDIVNGLLQNAKQTKEDFISSVKNELSTYLNKIDLSKEVDRILDNYDLEVTVKFKRKKKNDSGEGA